MNRISIILICIIVLGCTRLDKDDDIKIFRYNEAAGITSLDPAYARDLANIWACNQLYDGVVKLDDKLIVQPALAKSWEISPDGLTYTFTLRDVIFFHDHHLFPNGEGRKVNAFDVEYSFYRILDPEIASPGAWVFNQVADRGFQALNCLLYTSDAADEVVPV